MNCSGWCAKPLFSARNKISAGLPETDGTNCTIKYWADKTFSVGITNIITAGVLFLTLFGGIPLSCPTKGKEDDN